MAKAKNLSTNDKLGQEFWTQPEAALRNEAMQLMYSNLVAVLREEIENSHGSVVDYLIAERAAFMYSHMRERESSSAPGAGMTDRNRREMNKDLIDLLLTIKKLWSADAKDGAAEKVLTKVNKVLVTSISALPSDIGSKLMQELAEEFEAAGL